jgi:hypothetical protein
MAPDSLTSFFITLKALKVNSLPRRRQGGGATQAACGGTKAGARRPPGGLAEDLPQSSQHQTQARKPGPQQGEKGGRRHAIHSGGTERGLRWAD